MNKYIIWVDGIIKKTIKAKNIKNARKAASKKYFHSADIIKVESLRTFVNRCN